MQRDPTQRIETPSRRRFAGSVVTASLAVAAGCLGGRDDPGEDVSPIALDGERACDQCGMIIEDHPGPVGQVHFSDDEPEGGRPGQFCSGTCTYTYRFDASDAGREPIVTFLTDYSSVAYDSDESGGDTHITAHVESDAFGRDSDLEFVVNSEIVGSMGPDLIPFSDGQDAASFSDEYGGHVVDSDEIDRELIDAL